MRFPSSLICFCLAYVSLSNHSFFFPKILVIWQGRVDDNIETIRKRFKVFVESSLPVIEYYRAKDKVKEIDAAKPIPEVFEDVKAIFAPYAKAA
jgi:adenylate kinase family enzyme